jgi:hypothetical protein
MGRAPIHSTAMRRFLRYLFFSIAVVFVSAIVVQVFFAGLMLFGQEGGRDLHENTGYILGTAGALFLIVPALARAGRTSIVLGVILALITYGQPFLTFARETSPVIAALHPVNALLMFTLSLLLTRQALLLVRSERQAVRTET